METVNIALPESMKQFVQSRVSEGGYGSVSEYFHELIRSDQDRKAHERLEALLIEGIESGEPIPVTAEFWDDREFKLKAHIEKRPKSTI